MDTIKGLREHVETEFAESIVTRDDCMVILGSVPGLGPPDLCWLQKSAATPFSSSSTNQHGYYHWTLGRDVSSSAAVAAYFASLNSLVETPSLLQGLFTMKEHRIDRGFYCCYDPFSRLDIRCELTVPGGVVVGAVDGTGEVHDVTPELWKAACLGAFLRAELYGPELLAAGEGVYRYEPLADLAEEEQLLAIVEEMYRNNVLPEALHNLTADLARGCTAEHMDLVCFTVYQYFSRRHRWQRAHQFFSRLYEVYSTAAVYVAAAQREMEQMEEAFNTLSDALDQDPVNPLLLTAMATELLFVDQVEAAMKLARQALRLNSTLRPPWLLLARCYAKTDQLALALVVLNVVPIPPVPREEWETLHVRPPPPSARMTSPSAGVKYDAEVEQQKQIAVDEATMDGKAALKSLYGGVMCNREPLDLGPVADVAPIRATRAVLGSVYAILQELVAVAGWDRFLEVRSQVFLMHGPKGQEAAEAAASAQAGPRRQLGPARRRQGPGDDVDQLLSELADMGIRRQHADGRQAAAGQPALAGVHLDPPERRLPPIRTSVKPTTPIASPFARPQPTPHNPTPPAKPPSAAATPPAPAAAAAAAAPPAAAPPAEPRPASAPQQPARAAAGPQQTLTPAGTSKAPPLETGSVLEISRMLEGSATPDQRANPQLWQTIFGERTTAAPPGGRPVAEGQEAAAASTAAAATAPAQPPLLQAPALQAPLQALHNSRSSTEFLHQLAAGAPPTSPRIIFRPILPSTPARGPLSEQQSAPLLPTSRPSSSDPPKPSAPKPSPRGTPIPASLTNPGWQDAPPAAPSPRDDPTARDQSLAAPPPAATAPFPHPTPPPSEDVDLSPYAKGATCGCMYSPRLQRGSSGQIVVGAPEPKASPPPAPKVGHLLLALLRRVAGEPMVSSTPRYSGGYSGWRQQDPEHPQHHQHHHEQRHTTEAVVVQARGGRVVRGPGPVAEGRDDDESSVAASTPLQSHASSGSEPLHPHASSHNIYAAGARQRPASGSQRSSSPGPSEYLKVLELDIERALSGQVPAAGLGRRLCVRWLDELILALWHDLQAFNDWKANDERLVRLSRQTHAGLLLGLDKIGGTGPASTNGVQLPPRTTGDWLRRGALAERLYHDEDAALAYRCALLHGPLPGALLPLLRIYSDQGEAANTLLVAMQLLAWHDGQRAFAQHKQVPAAVLMAVRQLGETLGRDGLQRELEALGSAHPAFAVMLEDFDRWP